MDSGGEAPRDFFGQLIPDDDGEALSASARGGSGSGSESDAGDDASDEVRVPVTPAYVRELMPSIVDHDDELFEHHRMRCYQTMEAAAREKKWSATYELTDGCDEFNYAASEAALDVVYERLVHWLRDFWPQPETGAPPRRAFRFTWDPVVVPRTIERGELADPTSNVCKRLRWAQRALDANDPAVCALLREHDLYTVEHTAELKAHFALMGAAPSAAAAGSAANASAAAASAP